MTSEKPVDTKTSSQQPVRQGAGASKAEQAVRHAPAGVVAPDEKRAIAEETSREEDA